MDSQPLPVSNIFVRILQTEGKGYGMESHIIEGNNIIEVYTKVKGLVEDMREHPRPVLLEFKTFRMRGHEEASGTKYVPQDLLDTWEAKDPLINFENYLLEQKHLTQEDISDFKSDIKKEITDGFRFGI